jgi:ureidoacrylate peracid hydrolase
MTSNTAVIMIDMQNSYYATDGLREKLGYPPIWKLDETVEQCRLLLEDARSRGIPVIYTQGVKREDGADATPRYREAFAKALADFVPLSDDTAEWKSAIMDEVAPRPGDIVIEKLRWCSFTYTDLEPILKKLGITRLIVAGLQTNVCVETTVRTALMRNYEVAVPEDAVSTDGEDLHFNALKSMKVLYTEIAPWRELIDPAKPWSRAVADIHYGRD